MSSKAIFKGCHVFILVGYSICTIVFSIIAYKRISENVSDSLDIFNNWQRGPIIELNVSDTHPNGFEELFNYTWPGIDSGCDCRNILQSSRSFFKVKETTSHVSCSPSDRLAGCLDIPSAAPLNLNTWTKLNNKKVQVYALRSSNETWADVAVKSGDNCTEPNARKCGKSTNNVFCTMRDKCPITGISIDTVDMLSPRIAECAMEEDCWVLGNGTYGVKLLSALRGDDDDALPLVDVTVNEYAMCHTLDETNISPGRSDYEWQKSKRSTCDSSSQLWTTVDTITEKEFFDLNGLSTIIGRYNRSSYYAPGHNGMDYHWGVFARNYIPWNTQCRSRMDALIHESSKLQKLKVAQVLQLVFASILGFILGIVLSCMICADSTSAFVKVFNWVGKLLLVPFVLVSLLTAASISKFLSDEALDGCSDEGIVAVLTNMGVGAAAAYTNNLRTIITIGVALFLDLVLMICKRAQGEEEPYHPQVNIEVQGKY